MREILKNFDDGAYRDRFDRLTNTSLHTDKLNNIEIVGELKEQYRHVVMGDDTIPDDERPIIDYLMVDTLLNIRYNGYTYSVVNEHGDLLLKMIFIGAPMKMFELVSSGKGYRGIVLFDYIIAVCNSRDRELIERINEGLLYMEAPI
jgi:hypothetical protein